MAGRANSVGAELKRRTQRELDVIGARADSCSRVVALAVKTLGAGSGAGHARKPAT
ncbi:MAG: hypothetical protein QOE87_2279 [Gaiellales bacterium]|nr:hypothetical protein [Gaiellales bacterium]